MKLMQPNMTEGKPNVDAMRLLGTATRMMTTFQTGLLTLQKLKQKGKQTVVVKHVQVVQVQDGGQAVVAGRIASEPGASATGTGPRASARANPLANARGSVIFICLAAPLP